jgi:hypothetical protein
VEALDVTTLERLTPVVNGVQYFACNDPEEWYYSDRFA